MVNNPYCIVSHAAKCRKCYEQNKYVLSNRQSAQMSIKTSRVYFNIVMLRANVIPVNPQIHANVIRALFVLNFIFEPLFVHVPDIVHFLKFLLSTLVNKRR